MKSRFFFPFLALLAVLFQGCATVGTRPEAVEAPVPQAAQVKAQAAAQAPVAKAHKLKIAIGRFSNETNYGRSLLNDADLDRIGKQASDMLAARLVQSNQFVVLERPDIGKIKQEQVVAGVSGIVGSDTLIIGSVTEFGRSVGGKVGFLSSTKMQTAKAKVEARLVDVKTGHAYFSVTGSGEASTETGEVAGFGSRAEYDATLNDKAIGAAVTDMMDRLVSKLSDRKWKTDILEFKDGRVFITGGTHQGIKEGDVLYALEAGDTIKSKATGFDVTLPSKKVATLKVVSTFGDTETTEGAVCDVTEGTIKEPISPKMFVSDAK
jgi:curli biogenesis system outer membrane secretion channel CsgG